jgi:hypothetical protein
MAALSICRQNCFFHFGGFSVVFALIWLPEIFSLEEDIKKFNSQKRFFIDHMDGKVP